MEDYRCGEWGAELKAIFSLKCSTFQLWQGVRNISDLKIWVRKANQLTLESVLLLSRDGIWRSLGPYTLKAWIGRIKENGMSSNPKSILPLYVTPKAVHWLFNAFPNTPRHGSIMISIFFFSLQHLTWLNSLSRSKHSALLVSSSISSCTL